MKFIPKFIKGILLTALTAAVFCVNTDAVKQVNLDNGNEVAISINQETANDWLIPQALAVTDPATSPSDPAKGKEEEGSATDRDKILDQVGQMLILTHYIFNPAIFFFTNHIGNLLGNDLIFAGDMGTMLHKIWVVSRNIVNIVFVMLLLYLALKQIFFAGEGEGNADLKKALPTFVIMLIAINFSWLGTKLVLDAANVITNVTFAIPQGVQGTVSDFEFKPCNINANGSSSSTCMPDVMVSPPGSNAILNFKAKGSDVTSDPDMKKPLGECPTDEELKKAAEDKDHDYYKKKIFCWRSIDYKKYSKNNASMNLVYGMAKVQELTQANTGDFSVQGIVKAGMGFIFSIIIEIVYLLSFATLFLALLFRIAMLWIFVAFSPFLVLLFYLNKNFSEFGGGENELFSMKNFASWAFAPAKVGVVFSVGFIMISVGQTNSETFQALSIQGGSVGKTYDSINTLFNGMDNIWELIWLIMTIIIVWMGVFGVLKKLKGFEFIATGIERYAKGAAEKTASAGYYAPILPLGEGKSGRIADIIEPLDIRARMADRAKEWSGKEHIMNMNDGIKNIKKDEAGHKHLLASNNYEELVDRLGRHSDGKISETTLKNLSAGDIKSMATDLGLDKMSGGFDADKFVEHIKGKGATSAAERAGTAGAAAGATTGLSEADIKTAMEKALTSTEVKAHITKMPELTAEKVKSEAAKVGGTDPNMAIRQAFANLNHPLPAEIKLPEPTTPAANPATPPAEPPTGGTT